MTESEIVEAPTGTSEIVMHKEAASELFPKRMLNFRPEDFEVPILHLFQDAGKESEIYGEHQKGDWVDGITQEKIDSPHFVPVIGKRGTSVWHSRESKSDGFVGDFPDMAAVPPQYKEVEGEYDTFDYITWIGLVPGRDTPFALTFKSTAHRVGKSLNTAEQARQQMGRPAGVYALNSRDRSNDKGKWKHPVLTPKGECIGADAVAAVSLYNTLINTQVTIIDPGQEPVDVDFEVKP